MARALHYVFKIGNRNSAYEFFIKTLGMKVLRHEEFEEGCKATCNGPYDGKWSKTMVGYGEEDTHFVIELTYNYPIGSYKLGNDFKGIYIQSSDVFKRCQSEKNSKMVSNELLQLADPDGHCFFIEDGHRRVDPVYKLALNTPNLDATVDYWSEILGMRILSRDESHCLLSYGDDQCSLEWCKIDAKIERGTAFGRIAFAVPTEQLEPLEAKVKQNNHKIQTPLVKLDTPGKATVQVVILADPNDHEICFVGEEAFSELSKMDAKADEMLRDAMSKDDSGEWYKQGKPQAKEKAEF